MSIENMDGAPYNYADLNVTGHKLLKAILDSPVHEQYVELTVRRLLLERVTDNEIGRWNWLLWDRESSAKAASDEYDSLTDAERRDIAERAYRETTDAYISTINAMFASTHALGIDPRGLVRSPDLMAVVAALSLIHI